MTRLSSDYHTQIEKANIKFSILVKSSTSPPHPAYKAVNGVYINQDQQRNNNTFLWKRYAKIHKNISDESKIWVSDIYQLPGKGFKICPILKYSFKGQTNLKIIAFLDNEVSAVITEGR